MTDDDFLTVGVHQRDILELLLLGPRSLNQIAHHFQIDNGPLQIKLFKMGGRGLIELRDDPWTWHLTDIGRGEVRPPANG